AMEKRHVNLVGPTLLIGIGAILFLNNLGYLDWTVWDMLRLWPILLIGAGLEVLLGRQSVWASLVAAVILIGLIVGGIWLADTDGLRPARGELVDISYERGAADAAVISLEPTVGDITIGALVDSTDLMEGTIQVVNNEELRRTVSEGDPMEIAVTTQGSGRRGYIGVYQGSTWQLGINSDVELDLEVDIGVGDVTLDLSNLAIDSARLDFGLGRADATLPQEDGAEVVVDGGIGAVTIRVPEDVGAHIRLDAGLVGRTLPTGYTHDGDTYTSPNYNRADTRVDVTISLGIGNIRVLQLSGD
ncbi:MAG: LiaF-related protein, partial [Anaerolineae bacterium]|nr:LiaF-related protein [Anaerolineae bacterium]